VRALAKINLDLRVLARRPDGFHELRTIFQTISLADTLDLSFTPGRKTAIELEDTLGIPDNLVVRAARMVMEAMRATGRVEMRLTKRIPMGAGLGGGSSDAAAVLLALPALVGRVVDLPELSRIAGQLGSDVPFFLLGGTAVGIGRGTELFPLPDAPGLPGLLVAPGLHVNTAQAYRDLSIRLTTEAQQNKIFSFQAHIWGGSGVAQGRGGFARGGGGIEPSGSGIASGGSGIERSGSGIERSGSGIERSGSGIARGGGGIDWPANDFEAVVFEQHRGLALLKRRLERAGASVAMMSGSGSALFGLFADREGVSRACKSLGEDRAFRISLVSRVRYRGMWWRALGEHIKPKLWPPQSR
jgi:4-diphosphocytidyl-2-C-methyl-D-erythritol kinase